MALTLHRTRPLSLSVALAQHDARWLLGFGSIVVLLCATPYVVSALFGPTELERLGTFWFPRDFSQYEAAMREGASQPGWLIHDHFTAEAHQPAFIYPLYIAMGKVAAGLRVDPLALFAVMEWVGRLALVLALYAFARAFTDNRSARRLAVVLAAGSLGLMGLVAPLRGLLPWATWLPNTINVYLELSSFGVFLSAPHLMLGLALTLACAPLYLARRLASLGGAVFALSLLHPFNLPVLVSVLVVHALWNGRRWWPAAAVAVLASAPILLYNAVLFTTDPFWSGTYGSQNVMPAPAPWALPIDLGVVLLAAPLAWPIARNWPADRRRLVVLWIGLAVVWLYVPVPYQRRFAFGVQPALAVAAAVGLLSVANRLHSRVFNYVVVAATAATPVLVYVALIGSAVSNQPSQVYQWSRAEADAATWIAEHSTASDVVLASTEFANPLVGTIDGRVVHGHVVATLLSPVKQALVRSFYAADASAEERTRIIGDSQATLVVLGPRERALGTSDLRGQMELELVHDRAGVQVFRVHR